MIYFHRILLDRITKWIDRKEIFVIKGPRQSGKTTLLNIIREYLLKNKNINPQNIIYLTFEDRDILSAFERDPKEYIKNHLTGKSGKIFFLIDEFQYLKQGGQKLKLLYDIYDNVKFIITGSSSLELTGNTAKYLVGRMFSFHLFQFSFQEFLETKESNLCNAYLENSGIFRDFVEYGKLFKIKEDIYEKFLSKYLEEYMRFGGYPEVIKTADMETKKMILKNIYNAYVTKDIIELLRIQDISSFRDIVTLLANNMGGLVNYNHLAQDGRTYFRQLKQYLSVLEETFIIRILRPYCKSITTELKKNPKIYFVDSGLRNYVVNNFNELNLRQDAGKLAENVVLAELYGADNVQIKHWRTLGKAEVDFILDYKKEIVPVEVKYSMLKSPELSRGFRNFVNEYNPSKAVVLTKGYWNIVRFNKTNVAFIPIWYVRG